MPKTPYSKLPRQNLQGLPNQPWAQSIVQGLDVALGRSSQYGSQDGIVLQKQSNIQIKTIQISVGSPWISISGSAGAGIPGMQPSIPAGVGWTADPLYAARYMRHYDGTVQIQMTLGGGTSGSVFCVLPQQLRPDANILGGAFAFSGGGPTCYPAGFTIATNGNVTPYFTGAATAVGIHCRFMPAKNTRTPLPCFPIRTTTRFKTPPKAVLVAKSHDTGESGLRVASSPTVPSWRYIRDHNGQPCVQIIDIPWLEYNAKQRVDILIIGGQQ